MRNLGKYALALACLAAVASAERYPNQRGELILENGDPGQSGFCWTRFAGNATAQYNSGNVALATRITPQLLGVSRIVNDVYAGGTASDNRASLVKAAVGLGGVVVYNKQVLATKEPNTVKLLAKVKTARTLQYQNQDILVGAVKLELRAMAIGEIDLNVELAATTAKNRRTGRASLDGLCKSSAKVAYECRGSGTVQGAYAYGSQTQLVSGTIMTPAPYSAGYTPIHASFDTKSGGRLSGTIMRLNWRMDGMESVKLQARQPDKSLLLINALPANGYQDTDALILVE